MGDYFEKALDWVLKQVIINFLKFLFHVPIVYFEKENFQDFNSYLQIFSIIFKRIDKNVNVVQPVFFKILKYM